MDKTCEICGKQFRGNTDAQPCPLCSAPNLVLAQIARGVPAEGYKLSWRWQRDKALADLLNALTVDGTMTLGGSVARALGPTAGEMADGIARFVCGTMQFPTAEARKCGDRPWAPVTTREKELERIKFERQIDIEAAQLALIEAEVRLQKFLEDHPTPEGDES